ncbi:MAG TPA: Xaa-Pro peptidase family protein [Candidatus Dormibacteraeota bacterium]|nr:Xaa-Pro peptidase family protein [Candidatus Dormibacteraeota bacterium]
MRLSFFLAGFWLSLLLLAAAGSSFAIDRQPNSDYHARREALAKKANGVVVLFAGVENPAEVYGFRQDDNYYYLTGLTEPGSALLVASSAEAKGDAPARAYTEILFLPSHNPAQEKFTGPKLGPENPEAPKITGFDHVESMGQLPDEVQKYVGGRPVIYTDVATPFQSSTSAEPLQFMKRVLGFVSLQDVRPMISSLRTAKDAGEVALIRKAVDASVAAHFAAFKTVKPGVNEREIAALMEYEWGKRGCERVAYAPIVGSGLNSTVLHYSDDDNVMKSGDVVVIDAAGEYSMYASDITRTLPVNGHFTARQREIYEIVLGAQQAAADAFVSGKSNMKRDDPASLHKVAFDYINTHGKDLHGEPLGKYFIHGLGHSVGLNVHDATDYTVPFGPGQVFTIEPGIYIPEENLGVRIEDDYYVDPDGKLIKLSGALPSKADEVEKLMAGK